MNRGVILYVWNTITIDDIQSYTIKLYEEQGVGRFPDNSFKTTWYLSINFKRKQHYRLLSSELFQCREHCLRNQFKNKGTLRVFQGMNNLKKTTIAKLLIDPVQCYSIFIFGLWSNLRGWKTPAARQPPGGEYFLIPLSGENSIDFEIEPRVGFRALNCKIFCIGGWGIGAEIIFDGSFSLCFKFDTSDVEDH